MGYLNKIWSALANPGIDQADAFSNRQPEPDRPINYQAPGDGKRFLYDADGNQVTIDDMALPHIYTYASLASGANKTYFHLHSDEARRHSRENAIAMRNDVFLMGKLAERIRQVTIRKWHLEPDNPNDPWQKMAADGVTKIIKGIRRFHWCKSWWMQAAWHGRYGVEFKWAWADADLPCLQYSGPAGPGVKPTLGIKRQRILTASRVMPINGDKIDYHHDGTPYVLINPLFNPPNAEIEPVTEGMGLFLRGSWRDRVIIHKFQPEDADYLDADKAGGIHGVGLRSKLYWFNFMATDYLSWVTETLQRLGLGVVVIEYDVSNAAAKKEAEALSKKISRKSVILFPRSWDGRGSDGVKIVDVPVAGMELVLRMREEVQRQMQEFIVGQTMSGGQDADGSLGGTGRAKFAEDTKVQIAVEDALELDETITGSDQETGLVNYIFKHTYAKHGFDFPSPRYVTDIEDVDVEGKMNGIDKAISWGLPIKTESIYKLIGEPKPEDGDDIVGGQPPMDPNDPEGGGGGGQGNGGPSFSDEMDEDQDPGQGQNPEQVQYAADDELIHSVADDFPAIPAKKPAKPLNVEPEPQQPHHGSAQHGLVVSKQAPKDAYGMNTVNMHNPKNGKKAGYIRFSRDGLAEASLKAFDSVRPGLVQPHEEVHRAHGMMLSNKWRGKKGGLGQELFLRAAAEVPGWLYSSQGSRDFHGMIERLQKKGMVDFHHLERPSYQPSNFYDSLGRWAAKITDKGRQFLGQGDKAAGPDSGPASQAKVLPTEANAYTAAGFTPPAVHVGAVPTSPHIRTPEFKQWFGDWEADKANASKVTHPQTGEPQETHNFPGTGSVVVKNGLPVPVYHGTSKGGFDQFDKSKVSPANLYGPGFYFTEDKNVADEYQEKGEPAFKPKMPLQETYEKSVQFLKNDLAQAISKNDEFEKAMAPRMLASLEAIYKSQKPDEEKLHDIASYLSGAVVGGYGLHQRDFSTLYDKQPGTTYAAHLNIRKPFDADLDEIPFAKLPEKVQAKILDRYADNGVGRLISEIKKDQDQAKTSNFDYKILEKFISNTEINKILQGQGYDGITHIGGARMGDHSHRVWIAFEPHQIKSVENQGSFNPSDPRLHMQADD